MPAVVETIFSNAVPWSGEGTTIPQDKKFDIKECMKTSGLDWDVKMEDLVTVAKAQSAINYVSGKPTPNDGENEGLTIQPNVKHRAVIKSTDQSVLGVLGSRYIPLQNSEAFNWFQPLLDEKICSLHTAGSLNKGQKVWVLAELNKPPLVITKGDEVAKFVLLSNSHDGSTAVRVGFTPIRIWCANALTMVHGRANSQLLCFRHTGQLRQDMEKAREIMNLANQEFEATAEQYKWLATRHINVKDLQKYVKIVLGVGEVADEEIKTRTKNTIEQVIGLCESGMGNKGPTTYWAAYNGLTEYLNHHKGRTVSNRLNNLWFGVGATENKKALDLALSMAN